MMMAVIIGQLTQKLNAFLDTQGGKHHVTSSWVNNWLKENKAPFEARIVGKDGNEIIGATVLITKTRSS